MIERYREEAILLGLITIMNASLLITFENYDLASILIYTSLIVIPYSLLVQLPKFSSQNKWIALIISFTIPAFVIAFRNISAVDDPVYLEIYEYVANHGIIACWVKYKSEFGFIFLNGIFVYLRVPFIYFQASLSIATLGLFSWFFYKKRKEIYVPISVFSLITLFLFQLLSIGIVRMFLALAIVLNSYEFILDRKYFRYSILIILASFFHYSALFMLILLILYFDKDESLKVKMKLLLIITLLIPLGLVFITKLIVPLLGDKYAIYGEIGPLVFNLMDFDKMIPVFCFILVRKKYGKSKLLDYSIFLLTLSSIISFYNNILPFGRLVYYFDIWQIVGFGVVAKTIKEKDENIYQIVICLIFIFCLVYLLKTQFINPQNMEHLFPYKNYFINKPGG